MQREMLQEKSLSRSQGNAEKSLNVDLSAKSKLIPYSTTADMLGLYDLYTEERDACESYRMIFTVNPVCTNVIYNAVTEPVYKEGSLSAINLVETTIPRTDESFLEIFPNNGQKGTINQSGESIDRLFAIRDTEISHEKIGDFKYHCGYDIFNNHLLRTDDFEHVKLADETDKEGKHVNEIEFNTLFDFAVDYSGKTVTRVLGESDGPLKVQPITARERVRMYQLDNIKTINKSFYDELRVVDGWFGFYNTGYINIPNTKILNPKTNDEEDISINKILNNENACGFIDMYPDRTLYSFIPKVNRFKKRLERNWDCGIVYPYKNDYDTFNRVMINYSGTPEEWEDWKEEHESQIPNSVRVLRAKVTYNNVGDEIIEMHSLLRNTLKPGDEIRIFYTVSDYTTASYKEIFRYSVPIHIVSIGDADGNNEDRVFNVKLFDLDTICGVHEEIIQGDTTQTTKKTICLREDNGEIGDQPVTFFYRKIDGGCDDKYYFRKFKALKNYDYVHIETSAMTEEELEELDEVATPVAREPEVINETSPEIIKFAGEYAELISRPLNYTQNKIAFAGNIYGDRVAQVIFNDDICVSGLKDNLGRPLSTVYFTAIKTNRGYKDWYYSGNTSGDSVEYSHCFGELTSGLDLPYESASTNFNVRKLYNVFTGECQDPEEYLSGLALALEDVPVGDYIDGTPLPLESGITLDDFSEFYGDIVEFSRADFKENVLEKVYHRFNTAQRECLLNEKYYDIFYDEIVGDLFDIEQGTDNDK